MKRYLILAVALLSVFAFGCSAYQAGDQPQPAPSAEEDTAAAPAQAEDSGDLSDLSDSGAADETADPGSSDAAAEAKAMEATQADSVQKAALVKEIEVTARRFEFSPNPIEVNEGDTVRLKITSIDVTHGFVLSEFGISERLTPGNTVEVEFVADKKGEFSFFCNVVCGSGHSGMRGTLIVS